MKSAAVLRLAHKTARQHGFTVEEKRGRGKGSHRMYVVLDATGVEAGRFALTSHSRDISWTVLQSTEDALAHLLGEKWMEK